MSYIPFDPLIFPFLIYYLFLALFGLLITTKMFMNYHKKKHLAALYLTITFAALTLAIIVLAIGLLEAAITGYYKEIYRFSLPFAYSMVIVADLGLFKFSNELTNKGKKAFVPLLFIGAFIALILFLPNNYWGTPSADVRHPNIRMYSTMCVVLYSYAIYILNIILCQITKKYSDNKINKVRLSLLSYSMIALVLFFLMFIGDTFLIVFYDHPGYSIFAYIAWAFALVFLLLSYFSLFMPKKLLERLEKQGND
jgi:hypothetical protein